MLTAAVSGLPFVGGVRRPYDFAVVVDERRFDGGRARVDAEEVRALRAIQSADVHVLAMMAIVERLAIRFGREQRRHGGGVGRQILQIFKAFQNIGAGACFEMLAFLELVRFAGEQRGAERHVQVRVGRHDEFVDFAFERAVERLAQLGHEEQRTAQEDDGAVDWSADARPAMVCVATAVKMDAARSGLAAPSLMSG